MQNKWIPEKNRSTGSMTSSCQSCYPVQHSRSSHTIFGVPLSLKAHLSSCTKKWGKSWGFETVQHVRRGLESLRSLPLVDGHEAVVEGQGEEGGGGGEGGAAGAVPGAVGLLGGFEQS